MRNRLTAVLFDLDGTLLDTAPDMAGALNRLRLEEGLAELPYESIRPFVSHGSNAMIKVGFGETLESETFERLRKRFLTLYETHIVEETTLFPGMAELLDTLEANSLTWGIVTNKPGWLTEPLLKQLGLYERAACVVSGDTIAERKPDPQPLLHACELCGQSPDTTVYIGDAERDIEAGRRAGMTTIIAGFGYISDQDQPETWGADFTLNSAEEIQDWVCN